MNSEAHIIISFLFKRSGKGKLTEPEIYLSLSLELGWFSAREAKGFVTYALHQKLLVKKDGLLTPSFNVEKITVPVGFLPTEKPFAVEKTESKEEEKNSIDVIVKQIIEKTGKKTEEVFEEIKQVETEKNILPEVAVLLVAKEYGVALDNWFDLVEKSLF